MDIKKLLESHQAGVKPVFASAKPILHKLGNDIERHNGDVQSEVANNNNRTNVSSVNGNVNSVGINVVVLEDSELENILHARDTEIADIMPGGLNIRPGRGAVSGLNASSFPNKKIERIANAMLWRDLDDLLSALIQVKTDFAVMGARIRVQPPEGLESSVGGTGDSSVKKPTEPKPKMLLPSDKASTPKHGVNAGTDSITEFQGRLNQIWKKWGFAAIIDELVSDWFTADSCVLYWQIDKSGVGGEQKGKLTTAIKSVRGKTSDSGVQSGASAIEQINAEKQELIPGLIDICTLSPAEVNYDDSLGVEKLKIMIPDALRDRVKLALSQQDQKSKRLQELQDEGVSKKYIDAVTAGQSYVELSNDDGEYWIVCTKNRRHRGLANPSMTTIFSALETRQSFIDGDFVGAWGCKHHIMHISAGESITQGPLAGSQQNWISQTDTDQFLQLFSKPVRAHKVATNHTVKVNWLFPPKELFDTDKYKKSESRILDWAGITTAVFGGDGGSYAGGFLGIKKTIASMHKARNKVSHMMNMFFSHPSIVQSVSPPDECEVVATFDENALKDGKQLLQEIAELMKDNAMDPDTALKSLGYDSNAIRTGRLKAIQENESTGVWGPIAAQPDMTGGDGNTDTTKKDATKPAGRPSDKNTDKTDPVKNERPTAQ